MLATEVSELTVASDTVFVTLKALDGKFVSDFIRDMWTSRAFKVPLSTLKPAEKLMEYINGEISKAKLGGEAKPVEVKVPHCTSFTIEKVLEWLEDHADDAPYDEATFVPDVSKYAELTEADLLQFMLAADIFGIPAIQHTAAAKMAELINANPNPEEIMKMFDPENLDEEEVADEEMEAEDDSAALSAIQDAAKSVKEKKEDA